MPTSTPTKRSGRSSRSSRPAPSRRKPASEGLDAGSITNYTSALKWLYDHIDHERVRVVSYSEDTFSLKRMSRILDLLGSPQEAVPCVHIAGTKGKGSTCAMVASMLQSAGYAVGSYSSPHLTDLRERITIGGQMITYPEATDLLREIAEVEPKFLATRGINAPLTFFEIMTAAAFKYFADQAVDIAVLETGLGGRLDCTNVCEPLVTAVTAISLDHTQFLGDDVVSIAKEKAGIFKPGVPAITLDQPEADAHTALAEAAEAVGTTLEVVGKDIDFSFRFEANKELGPHSRVCLTTDRTKLEHLPVPLKGEHQAANCGIALAILDRLKEHGYTLPDAQVIAGLEATELPGRMEQVWDRPKVILDGAHNAASMQALIKSLGAHIQYDSLVMIFGCAHDKDIKGMLDQVALGADKVIFTQAKQNPRAVEPAELLKDFSEITGKMAQPARTFQDALGLAARAVSREDLIVITGSFYLVGEARKHFMEKQRKADAGR
ncbi:MAG: folylpolyglutamate synthase/dihydrofolate synthase family protein [Planctomycetota bacterium]